MTGIEFAELTRLRRLAAAREGKPGFAANVAEIRARIAQLEAKTEPLDEPPSAA